MEDASKLQSLPSSSRVMRNIAEKQRRDKLNGYINELSTLVPTVAQAPRKLDKTSILRLAASYLRLYQNVPAAVKRKNIAAETPETRFTKPLDLLQSFDSFLVVLSVNQAKILHITENVENLLSYSQVDMLGISFYHFVHLEDHGLFRSQILPHTGFETSRTNDSMSDQRSFCFRIGTKGVSRNEPIIYEKAMLWGHCKLSEAVPSLDNKTNYSDGFRYPGPFRESALPSKTNDMVFVGVVKLLSRKLPSRLTLLETLNDEYMTRHTLDPGARIIMTDHRISTIAGYLADEVTGKSALSFMNPEDLPIVRSALKTLFSSPDGESTIVYRLIRCDGSLIYLRTRGYMEYEPGTKAVKSLICINTLLSEEEGKKALDEARDELGLETGTAVETRISRSSHNIPALTSPDGIPPTSCYVPGQRTRTVSNQDPASPDSGISVNGNDSFVVTDLDSGKPLNLVTCQKFYNDTPSSENLYGAWPKCEETFGLVMRRRGRPSLVYEPYK